MECVRGAMDAARRLSRVHLRSGNLVEARAWLQRAIREVYQPRCVATFNDRPSPFRLRDALLDSQFEQARVELELTSALLKWDGFDSGADDDIAAFARPRFNAAARAIQTVKRIGAQRLVPEFTMHAFRLAALLQEREHDPVKALEAWFESDGLTYQSVLLQLQVAVFLAPGVALLLEADASEIDEFATEQPADAATFAHLVQQERAELGDSHYQLARQIGDVHHNPYWYARGLCAAAIVGTAADRESSWLRNVRDEMERAAIAISREDWIEKVDNFDRSNIGLWLLGY